MDIVFLWNSNLNNEGVILSGKYNIKFDLEEKELLIERRDDYVYGFWGQNVQDCYAIVGDNGSGKTRLVNEIMKTIYMIQEDTYMQYEYLLLVEDEKTRKLSLLFTDCFKDLSIQCEDDVNLIGKKFFLYPYQIAYFHNVMSEGDYLSASRCNYDFSLGYMMNRARKITVENFYDTLNVDAVVNFYDNDTFRIISFIYRNAINNDLDIEFPVPKYISIQISDDKFTKHYIMDEAKKIHVDKGEENRLSRDIFDFYDGINNIVKCFGTNWINHTIKILLLNCFKKICIPRTNSKKISDNHMIFFQICDFMQKKKISHIGAYGCAYKIIKELKETFKKEKIFLSQTEQYIHWLQENEETIKKFENYNCRQLDVPTGENTETFMNELIKKYSAINLYYPFYCFHFGISSGEYCFLSIFSNLYSIIRDKSNIDVFGYPTMEEVIKKDIKGLLLIFDEADLSMHPKWQRMFMKWIVDCCNSLFVNIPVKIIVTTHSPILLSDFPGNSVLYVQKNGFETVADKSETKKTFASNIHTLFLDSFFLNEYGTIGAFAEEKINRLVYCLTSEEGYEIDQEKVKKIINYVGEKIIRQKLLEMLTEDNVQVRSLDDAEKTIITNTLSQLKLQKNHLEQLIKNLEDAIND